MALTTAGGVLHGDSPVSEAMKTFGGTQFQLVADKVPRKKTATSKRMSIDTNGCKRVVQLVFMCQCLMLRRRTSICVDNQNPDKRKLPLVIAAMVAIADYGVAHAAPVKPQPLAAPTSDIQLAYEVVHGPRGGAAYRGPRAGVAVRGPYGGAAVRGPFGGAAVRGPCGGRAVVGRPYYGGVWYGTGRAGGRARSDTFGFADNKLIRRPRPTPTPVAVTLFQFTRNTATRAN
jgi:hypothetical protein